MSVCGKKEAFISHGCVRALANATTANRRPLSSSPPRGFLSSTQPAKS